MEFIELCVNCKNQTCEIKYKYWNCFCEYTNVKDDSIAYKCLCCNKNYQQRFDKKLKERFFNTYKFSNQNKNKFFLLFKIVVYPYEYIPANICWS